MASKTPSKLLKESKAIGWASVLGNMPQGVVFIMILVSVSFIASS